MKNSNNKPTKKDKRFSRENLKRLAARAIKANLVMAFFFVQGCAITNHSWKTTMWYDEKNQLQEFSLDMTKGTCFTDGEIVYLWVEDKYSKEKGTRDWIGPFNRLQPKRSVPL